MKYPQNNLDQILKEYSDFLEGSRMGQTTKKQYVSDARKFIAIYKSRLSDITRSDVKNYISQLKVQKAPFATIKRKQSSLNHFLRFLEAVGIINVSPRIDSFFVIPKFHAYMLGYMVLFTIINGYFVYKGILTNNERVDAVVSLPLSEGAVANFQNTVPTYLAVPTQTSKEGQVFNIAVDQEDEPFGQAVIKPGNTEVMIFHQNITSNSLVFVTPVSAIPTGNSYQVTTKNDGTMKIQLSMKSEQPIMLNWLVKNYTSKSY